MQIPCDGVGSRRHTGVSIVMFPQIISCRTGRFSADSSRIARTVVITKRAASRKQSADSIVVFLSGCQLTTGQVSS